MDVSQIFDDMCAMERECNERRLTKAAKWFSETLFYMSQNADIQSRLGQMDPNPLVTYPLLKLQDRTALRFAQSCIDNGEFDRAAHCTEASKDLHVLTRFIHYSAKFLAGEKTKADHMVDVADKNAQADNRYLTSLHTELDKICASTGNEAGNDIEMSAADASTLSADAYILYLYGLVLKDLGFKSQAMAAFVRSLNAEQRFWPAWQEVAKLVSTKDEIIEANLPDCWMKDLFMGEAYLSLHQYSDALQIYIGLRTNTGLADCPYVMTQMAVAHHHLQDVDSVVETFQAVRKNDPYRLEHMDLLSNSLFVKGMKPDLAALAHHCTRLSKYSPETCLVVGNYYSIRGEHDKAVIYFQRALKLDARKSDAWTLLGHEFMELKNTAAATLSYRKALEIDPHDYRAWYGLGQHYDILKMPNYAMYYYNMAQKVQPHDSRMVIALGEMYEKQGKYDEARKCYWKAHLVGDVEGQALVRLGKLYEKLKNSEQAAAAYAMFLAQLEQRGVTESDQQPNCFRFLADYHTTKQNLEDAQHYAQLCLEYDSTKEEARGILRRISQLRGDTNGSEMQVTQ